MVEAGVGFHKKTRIFITHMHGDHVLGLPGLLQTMSLLDRIKELEIYGPVGIKDFVEAINNTVLFNLAFPIRVSEIGEHIACETKEYIVRAIQSSHINPSLSYSLIEKARPGRFHPEKAKELGVPEGPLWSRLQSGNSICLKDGRIIEPEMVLDASRPGRKIVYTGDTGPSENVVKLAENADLLIHEASFEDNMRERAIEDGHSTPSMAASTAKAAGVKWLVLTHISARYKSTKMLLRQAKEIFPNTEVAEDFLELELPLIDS